MIDVAKHIREVVKDELNRLKMGDTLGFALDGPAYVPTPDGQLTVGWLALITIKHNTLIGVPDLGVSVPVYGVRPPDDIFRKTAQMLLEEARKERHKMSQKPPEPSPREIAAAQQAAKEGVIIPPGVLTGPSMRLSERPS